MKRRSPGFWSDPDLVIEEFADFILANNGFINPTKKLNRFLSNAFEKYPYMKLWKDAYCEEYSIENHVKVTRELIIDRLTLMGRKLGLEFDGVQIENSLSNRGSTYTPVEIEFLKNNRDKSFYYLALHLGRHKKAVRTKFYSLNLRREMTHNPRKYSDPWSKEELAIIKEHGGKVKDGELIRKYLQHIPRVNWIARKRKELGITEFFPLDTKDYFEWNNQIYYRYKEEEAYYQRYIGEGKYALLHVDIYEDSYNVKVQEGQVIHHINGDATDNSPENLHLLENQSIHRSVHGSAQRLGFQLYNLGHIAFNGNTGEYYLN